MLKNLKPWTKSKPVSDSYLKYEEGEVVPVEQKRSLYPPFLNDEDEKDYVPVTHFKDTLKKEPHSNEDGSEIDSPKAKTSSLVSIVLKFSWFAILLVLIYSFVPIFSYFASETPKLLHVDQSAIEKVSSKTDTVKEIAKETKEVATDTIDTVKEGSGLVDMTQRHLAVADGTGIPAKQDVSLNKDQWLNLITEAQDQKQTYLLTLKEETSNYLNEHMSQSKYRLKVKNINQKINRLQNSVEMTIEGQDTREVAQSLSILLTQLTEVGNLAVDLGSISVDDIPVTFNSSVEIQNQLTKQYRSSFIGLLVKWGYSYAEVDGFISYSS